MKDVGKKSIGVNYKSIFRDLYYGYEPVAIQLIDESKGTERAQRRIRSIDGNVTKILEDW